MRGNLNVNEIASLGSNVKPVIRNENCSVHMLNDTTGEGVMTIYRVMPGVMICFSDIHMEQCVSEFELKNDRKIFCIDHCREGRNMGSIYDREACRMRRTGKICFSGLDWKKYRDSVAFHLSALSV